jgi:quinol monooxygenase YgiN
MAMRPRARTDIRVVTVRMKARTEKRREFVQTVTALTSRARDRIGCRMSQLYIDGEDPNAFAVVAEWSTQESLDAYLRSDDFSVLMGMAFLLTEAPRLTLDVVSRRTGAEDLLRRSRANSPPAP